VIPQITKAREAGRRALDEPAAKAVLARWGIAVPRSARVGRDEPVDPAVAGLSPPFALKLVAAGVLHKSDVGGVALGLGDADAVEAARRTMLASPAGRAVEGFMVEEMAPPGHELVLGGIRDPRFGPVVMLGLGGVFVEVLGDAVFRICPLRPEDARAMLAELRGAAILRGARGGVVADEEAIVDVLMRLGGAGGLFPTLAHEIAEIDINPLIVSASGAIAADARIVLGEPVAPAVPLLPAPTQPPSNGLHSGGRHGPGVLDRFAPLFRPRGIAVLGASAGGGAPANNFIRHLRDYGFAGPIYPVHPRADIIDGLPPFRSLAQLPEPVDYAFVAIAAPQVPAALREAAGRVRIAQVMSSGFAEAEGGSTREAELVAAAREGGMRLLGPNCLGTHSPRGRLTFIGGMPAEPGRVGIVSQSGGLAMDAMRRGRRRGLGFSGVVTVGNSADLGAADLLEYFLADPETRVVGLYLEDARDGRRLFELMADAEKPIVLLKGGRSREGQRAALSHTGALATDDRIWAALARQTGAAMVETLDGFVDALLAFQLLAPRPQRPTRRVALFGNGGGASVLAADHFARAELEVSGFGEATAAALRRLALPAGSSIGNPIDVPANILRRNNAEAARDIFDAVLAHGEADAVVVHVNMPVVLDYPRVDILGNLIEAALETGRRHPGQAHLALVLRSDGEPEIEAKKQAYRARALAAGIPVFDELPAAAGALAALAGFERRRRSRGVTGVGGTY
jgi:acyl-CoA synthetase (NDP forming)